MGDKTSVIDRDVEVSYSELWQRVVTLSKGLSQIGIGENDVVVLFLPNCVEFVYAFFALARVRAISVPLSIYLTPFELEKVFHDCRPTAIVTSSPLAGRISSITRQDTKVIITDDFNIATRETHSLGELFKMGSTGDAISSDGGGDEVASINYTYRGTGNPMGAMLTHSNYQHGFSGYVRLTEFSTDNRILMVTPISHILTLVACVIVPLLQGATLVISERPAPKSIFATVQKHKIDFMIGVPTIWTALLRNYKPGLFDTSSLKRGITGASPMSADIQAEITNTMGIELYQGYGLTETLPIVCSPRNRNKPSALGVPGHEVRVKIVDESGAEAPPSKVGEILVGGPTVMKGYLNVDLENKDLLKDGWLHTGDHGWSDEDGYIHFSHLAKNIAKVGGFTVDLKEVKDTLLSHPAVSSAEIKAKPHELWGSMLEAQVRCSKDCLSARELRDYCGTRLASYKIPRTIDVNR